MEKREIIHHMPLTSAERNACTVDKPPEEPADEAEHVKQRKHAQKCVICRERQIRCPVVCRGEQGISGQNYCPRALCRTRGKEEDPGLFPSDGPAADLLYTSPCPEPVDIRSSQPLLHQTRIGQRLHHHDRQSRRIGGKNFYDRRIGTVHNDAFRRRDICLRKRSFSLRFCRLALSAGRDTGCAETAACDLSSPLANIVIQLSVGHAGNFTASRRLLIFHSRQIGNLLCLLPEQIFQMQSMILSFHTFSIA